MNNKYCGKGKSHAASDILWGALYDQGVMDNGTHKENIIIHMFPEVLKSRSRGKILKKCTICYPIDRS